MTIQNLLSSLEGISFQVRTPFLVADMQNHENLFALLEVEQYGMENVSKNQTTQSHGHDFVSVYKTVGLNVISGDQEIVLPETCVTIVLPNIEHRWVPKHSLGWVGSIDPRHQKQIILNVVTVA